MSSQYLKKLTPDQRDDLVKELWKTQGEKCFISGKIIDLTLHVDSLDIDHIEPTRDGGKDNPSNFALTHSGPNRSKQTSNLRIARILWNFNDLIEECASDNRKPNLGDVLKLYDGSKFDLSFNIDGQQATFTFPDMGVVDVSRVPIYKDKISEFDYFFTTLPIEYLHHDDFINPRPIGPNLRKLIEEFNKKRPQLHVALGYIELPENGAKCHVKLFDGQHKAAAQILLGVRELPVRIFINPDKNILLTANTHAGTTLRQVAFDKSVQRHLGSQILSDRIDRYREDRGHPEDYEDFSEQDIVDHFKGEHRAMKRYVIDALRNSVTQSKENNLRIYIELGGRSTTRPFSYSSIEKTFYSFFICQDLLTTPFNWKVNEDKNPRILENDQIIKLMNILAEEIYIGKFDDEIGTSIEKKIQKDEDIPEDHMRAVRMAREEVLSCWLHYINQIIEVYFINLGIPIASGKIFHNEFPDTLWDRIRAFIRNFGGLPLWVNIELSRTVFGAKQNVGFWETIFTTGSTPEGTSVLVSPINLIELMTDNKGNCHLDIVQHHR